MGVRAWAGAGAAGIGAVTVGGGRCANGPPPGGSAVCPPPCCGCWPAAPPCAGAVVGARPFGVGPVRCGGGAAAPPAGAVWVCGAGPVAGDDGLAPVGGVPEGAVWDWGDAVGEGVVAGDCLAPSGRCFASAGEDVGAPFSSRSGRGAGTLGTSGGFGGAGGCAATGGAGGAGRCGGGGGGAAWGGG